MSKHNEKGNNNKHKGEMAQKMVIAALARYEVEVALPMSDNLPFDFIAIYNNKLYKVQVKSSSRGNNGDGKQTITFACASSNWWNKTTRKYTAEDADALIGYDWIDDGVYVLDQQQFVARKSFSIRKVATKSGMIKGCNFAENFVLSEKRLAEVFT